MKIAYFDCFSGISGDMAVGALLDTGVSLDYLNDQLGTLPFSGFTLLSRKVNDKGFVGTQFSVHVAEAQPERHLGDIVAGIEASGISVRAKETAVAVFNHLANAEAAVHGVSVEQVHFHEVGAVDSIVDIVGVAVCLDDLGVEAVFSSPVPTGSGSVGTSHGVIPVPGPAVLWMLAESRIPTRPGLGEGELSTPTGVALLSSLARFEQPDMALRHVGVGFGQKRFEWPNMLRVWLAEQPANPSDLRVGSVVEIEANVDDMTAEAIGWTVGHLMRQGALDVFLTPIQMKKGRPATKISVIANPADLHVLSELMIRHLSTLGVRWSAKSRFMATRESETIETPWGSARVKWKVVGEVRSPSPEYEDVAAIAERVGLSFSKVYEEVSRIAQSRTAEKNHQ